MQSLARAHVAIDGDRITAIGAVDEKGRREIDAAGKLVTPGFVDIHTHLDAQLFWDPDASSSCFHGVTTVVMGNDHPCLPATAEIATQKPLDRHRSIIGF